jgi:hypothetical protein
MIRTVPPLKEMYLVTTDTTQHLPVGVFRTFRSAVQTIINSPKHFTAYYMVYVIKIDEIWSKPVNSTFDRIFSIFLEDKVIQVSSTRDRTTTYSFDSIPEFL